MKPAFDSLNAFLSMSQPNSQGILVSHGVYVWSCWALTVAAVVWLIWHSRRQRQRFMQQEHARLRRLAAQSARQAQAATPVQSVPSQSELGQSKMGQSAFSQSEVGQSENVHAPKT